MKVIGNFSIKSGCLVLRKDNDEPTSLRVRFTESLFRYVEEHGKLPHPNFMWPATRRSDLLPTMLTYTQKRYEGEDYGHLIGYVAKHPRQRIQVTQDAGYTMLRTSDYGRSVIALMKTDSTLTFRHKNFEEKVFFDGDRLVTHTKELETK